MKVLVTGSSGLIGSEVCSYFAERGHQIFGVDNNQRAVFFGLQGDTTWRLKELQNSIPSFNHNEIDIRDREKVLELFRNLKPDAIVHTAAQPSHDWAAKEPMTDFTVNAVGTMVLLEQYRKECPKASFVFTSTNKVYGDTPNFMNLSEMKTRYELVLEDGSLGAISENMSIDASKHSVFGASKVAADIMVQEYGKYFGLNTVCFRGGCLTGPSHQGAELHGFLSYLLKCMVNNKPYTIFGYKGKQVRDNIHSHDLVTMFDEYITNPRPGEVYNAGGGRNNAVSILEAIEKVNNLGIEWNNYTVDPKNRIGDHMWYISDLTKFKRHYPNWKQRHNIDSLIFDMVEAEKNK